MNRPNSARKTTDILIIGGGVIGVCCAHFLTEAGARVTLIERDEIASGSSYGNAGLYVPSHSIPLAAPGALRAGLLWMLDPESPFYVRRRLAPDLWAWILRFGLASREGPMRRAVPILRDLSVASGLLYHELATLEGPSFDYGQAGLLTVFRTAQGLKHGVEEAALLGEFGLRAEVVEAGRARVIEPALRDDVLGGVYFPDDAHLDPAKFVRGLAKGLAERGARIETHAEAQAFSTERNRIVSVRTTRGEFRPDQVVLAAGAWTPAVARDLRLGIPVQGAKGYSLTIPRPANGPSLPLMLGEARVAVTPMGDRLRFAGTLELAGLDSSINAPRVNAIARAAREYLRVDDVAGAETWAGLRPCTPDGLPIIGRTRRYENLVLATGHGMLGMSLGPVTGKLVAQLAMNLQPDIDLEPLRLERFRA
jgi:D-amino-acid dehydrogenase